MIPNQMTSISVHQLMECNGHNCAEIIDVRTPVEFREVRAATARNVPLDVLDPHAIMRDRNGSADEPLYVICKAGNRGEKARQKFAGVGFTQVINIEGGTEAWANAGLPVVRGKKAVSLERQVRIAAGFFVLVGGAAGNLCSSWFCRNQCIRGSRTDVCRDHGLLPDGHDDRSDAVESGWRLRDRLQCKVKFV